MQDLLEKAAEDHWQRLSEVTDLSTFSLTKDPLIQEEIRSTLGLSDFIAEQVISRPELLNSALQFNSAEAYYVDYYHNLSEALANCPDEESGQSVIRRFRNQHMVAIAWQDLNNKQNIEKSLQQVSDLADAIILATYHWLYQILCKKYGTPMGPLGPQPMFIIAMGKLGGKELNYSSDIDLIFAYPEPGEITTGRKSIEHQTFFTRLGQRLIKALNQITVDGQAFRVDMRLRPFGDSGPLVSHLAALEDYYQEQGREWERYAMVKARVLNSESPYVEELYDILRPFVFRRYIDFGVIDSLRNMKKMIQQEVRRRKLNNNIKLGKGGIREAEFIVQSFQLIRGGREPQLQTRNLLSVLQTLAKNQILSIEDACQLRDAYLYLRKAEHCLQQFGDEQTQNLPDDALTQARLIKALGCQNFVEVLQQIDEHMENISQQFGLIIGDIEEEEEDDDLSNLKDLWTFSFDQDMEADDARSLLAPWLSEQQQQQCFDIIFRFKSDISKKALGARGAETLDKLMPRLFLEIFNFAPNEAAEILSSLIQVISRILQRTAYLELLLENLPALQQLVKLCHSSPWIAQQIRSFPILLDELLNPADLYNPTPPEQFSDLLRQQLLRVPQDDLEQQMESLRQFKLSQQLRIAAADITGALPVNKVSDHLTVLAEVIVAETVQMAWQQMTERYGYPAGASEDKRQFAVVAYGKLGGIELGYGSDLDLVFLHHCDSNAGTDGAKSIDSKQFYIKLSQRIIHIFTTKTSSGDLYEVDMRLRPSGNSGLLVSHINAFENYQEQEAWTWEHQALMRGRFIHGDSRLRARFQEIRYNALAKSRDIDELKKEIKDMREKMRKHLNKGTEGQFDLKQDKGGITDIEFLVQFWVLANASQHKELTRWSDNLRILEQLCQLKIIDETQMKTLTDSYLGYRNTGHRLSLACKSVLDATQQFNANRDNVIAIWEYFLKD